MNDLQHTVTHLEHQVRDVQRDVVCTGTGGDPDTNLRPFVYAVVNLEARRS